MAAPAEGAVSPRSPTSILADESLRIAVGGHPPDGIAVRHHPTPAAVWKDDGGVSDELVVEEPNCGHSANGKMLENGSVKVPCTVDEYKRSIIPIIKEYFSAGDLDSASSELRNVGCDQHSSYFVKKLISMAMDRRDKEKEMASVLLSALYGTVLTRSKINEGFMMLLESAEDLAVDIPDTVDILALFIARAVVDDILPPVFVTQARALLPEFSKGVEVLKVAEKGYLSAPHHAELVERRWGGRTHTSVEEVKRRIHDLLSEYVESGDVVEACRCIRELRLPFFHHEVVKRALICGIEAPASEPLISNLLRTGTKECLISSDQMSKGFCRLAESIEDLCLDVPAAKSLFDLLVSKASSEGWLDLSSVNFSIQDKEMRMDDDDEKLRRFKAEAVNIIQEYFLSDDIPELIRSLEELSAPEYNAIFVKKLVTLALDRKNKEKEMASVLLSSLSVEFLSTEDLMKGFLSLLQSAEDTALDILDASNELALFLARAIIDEVLVPHDLDEIFSQLRANSSGSETVHMARALLAARHSAERILRCWGGGSGWAVEDAKDKISKLLEEYTSGGDLGEACKCIRDLGMPFFNHEVVKKALTAAMENRNEGRIMSLLQECSTEGLITMNQMTKGFSRLQDCLDDLTLDVPSARHKFASFVDYARDQGWLLPTFTAAAVTGTA